MKKNQYVKGKINGGLIAHQTLQKMNIIMQLQKLSIETVKNKAQRRQIIEQDTRYQEIQSNLTVQLERRRGEKAGKRKIFEEKMKKTF